MISTTTDSFFYDKWNTQHWDSTEPAYHGDMLNGKTISVSKTKDIILTIPVFPINNKHEDL